MADAKVVEAREAFSVPVGGVPIGVSVGDRFYDDDPVVIGREHLFRELTVRSSVLRPLAVSGPPSSETADATPGTARNLSRPGGRGARNGRAERVSDVAPPPASVGLEGKPEHQSAGKGA